RFSQHGTFRRPRDRSHRGGRASSGGGPVTPARPSEWLRLLAGVEPAVLDPGSTGHVIVEAVLPAGGHIEAHEPPEPFLIPTVLELSGIDGISYGPVSYPEPSELELSWSPVRLKVLTGRVRFAVPLEAHISALPGPRNISAA